MSDDWIPPGLDTDNVSLENWEFIYANGGWLEQGSGPGSTIANNSELITWMTNFISTNSCSSIIDIGCGEMQWTSQILSNDITYTGIDWVSSIYNTKKNTYPAYTFLTEDFASSGFSHSGTYDLLICKDILQHAYDDVDQIFSNIENINATHKMIIIPEVRDDLFQSKTTGGGYTLATMVTSDEEKNIYVKSI